MKKVKIVLTNDFHEKATTAVVTMPKNEGYTTLSKGQVNRIKKELCGIANCACSGDLGIKGYQYYIDWHEIDDDGSCLIHLREF